MSYGNEPQAPLPGTTLDTLLRRVVDGQETVFDVATEADGTRKVIVGQRKLQPEILPPQRAESPARAHVLHTAAAVCDYVNEYGSDKTVILLDSTTLDGRIVLYEDADEGFEVLTFKPVVHPLFAEWEPMLTHRVEVAIFAEFILGHRRQVIEPDGKTLAGIFSQVRADKTTEIHRGTGKNAINGVTVSVKISGKVQELPVELPDTIQILVPLFVGMDPSVIEVDLLVQEFDNKVYVSASAAGVLEAKHAAFAAMVEEIREGIEYEKATVGLGKIGHSQWAYLKA